MDTSQAQADREHRAVGYPPAGDGLDGDRPRNAGGGAIRAAIATCTDDVACKTFSCTFGTYTQTKWTDRRSVPWQELVRILTTHAVGRKEGSCIVPALFRGNRRHKADADQIDVAFLDSDGGATLVEIAAAMRSKGWTAVISSTHSHLTTTTKANRRNWQKFFSDCPINAEVAYLVEVKGMLPRAAAGAVVENETDEFVIFRHNPCCKFRIVLPLCRPWRAADYPSQDVANAVWKECIEALAAELGLQHDQSCVDTSRLFYLPRRPSDGPLPETLIIAGELCDIFALPAAAEPFIADGARRRWNGVWAEYEYTDPNTGEMVDLRAWAREYADRFLITKALRTRRPSVLTGRIADRIKVHIRCSNEHAHTQAGADAAAFIIDAGDSSNGGFVYHCRHAHCDGKDRLFFLSRRSRNQ
jgi:hypothetical protein